MAAGGDQPLGRPALQGRPASAPWASPSATSRPPTPRTADERQVEGAAGRAAVLSASEARSRDPSLLDERRSAEPSDRQRTGDFGWEWRRSRMAYRRTRSIADRTGTHRFFAQCTGQTIRPHRRSTPRDGRASRPVAAADLPVSRGEFDAPGIEEQTKRVQTDPYLLHGEERYVVPGTGWPATLSKIGGHHLDIYEKKGGAMEFVARRRSTTTQRGEHVARRRVRPRRHHRRHARWHLAIAAASRPRPCPSDAARESTLATTLALYRGRLGDHNPIHIDTDYARKAGMPDVFAHGMSSMPTWAAAHAVGVARPHAQAGRAFCRHHVPVHDQITCTGRWSEAGAERRAACELEIERATSTATKKIVGDALIALD